MAKTDLQPLAERLYVSEQCTLAEIAKRLNVAERTIRNWKEKAKADGGDWDLKRQNLLASRQSFHEELYDLARDIASSIREDLKEGREVAPSRMSFLARLLPQLVHVKDYEAVAGQRQDQGAASSPDEVVGLIRGVLLGPGS